MEVDDTPPGVFDSMVELFLVEEEGSNYPLTRYHSASCIVSIFRAHR